MDKMLPMYEGKVPYVVTGRSRTGYTYKLDALVAGLEGLRMFSAKEDMAGSGIRNFSGATLAEAHNKAAMAAFGTCNNMEVAQKRNERTRALFKATDRFCKADRKNYDEVRSRMVDLLTDSETPATQIIRGQAMTDFLLLARTMFLDDGEVPDKEGLRLLERRVVALWGGYGAVGEDANGDLCIFYAKRHVQARAEAHARHHSVRAERHGKVGLRP